MWDMAGSWNSLAVMDRMQVLFSSGNIASGIVRVYGVSKTRSAASGSSGGRVLISEVTPSGAGVVTLASSIEADYKKLEIEFAVRSTVSAYDTDLKLKINNDSTSANYNYVLYRANPFGGTIDHGNDFVIIKSAVPGATATANYFAIGKIELVQYTNTSMYKGATIQLTTFDNAFAQEVHGGMVWASLNAINRLDMEVAYGNFAAGTVIRLYGVT
jgi:hypothetical protein